MSGTNTNWKIVKIFQERANKINCKEHFNAKEFDLTLTKIATIRKTKNCKYNINYHFTWIPKCRAKIMVAPFNERIKKYLLQKCNAREWDPLALQIMPDHIHFFISAAPKWAPSKIIQELKAYSSKELRKEFSIIREMRYSEDFWASGYYCGTAGHITAQAVARYIAEQNEKLEGKWHLFDLEPFEYNILDGKARIQKYQTRLDAYA